MSEILSPVGSYETLLAALDSGADAVYFGSKHFSARQNATNISEEEIPDLVFECHKRGVKAYQAINTLFFDDERKMVEAELERAAVSGVDGLIIQDLGVLRLARECIPEMPLHASTQLTIHSPSGAKIAKRLGFKRVVLSRECTLDQIEEIVRTGIETEVFVHGALCMSVSGQCYLSAMLGSRSANRGLCAGACRLPFCVDKSKDDYALSLKDLCALDRLETLKEIGATSFKIEGRMKRPEYVAAATAECRRSLYEGRFNKQLLRDVFSRDGFTNGYIENKIDGDMFGHRQKEDVLSAKDAFSAIHEEYKNPFKRSAISFSFKGYVGENASLQATDSEGKSVTVYGERIEKARKTASNSEIINRQLSKLGDTIYSLGEVKIYTSDDAFIPVSMINSLRRQAVAELDKIRAVQETFVKRFKNSYIKLPEKVASAHTLRIRAQRAQQLERIDLSQVELVCLPFSEAQRSGISKEKLCVTLDRFMVDESVTKAEIDKAIAAGITHFLAQNIAHLELLKDKDVTVHAGFGMNITNSYSLDELSKLGVADTELSLELTDRKISSLKGNIKCGVAVYGKLPLMLLRNCPIKAKKNSCKGCQKKLIDRKGKTFTVSCHKEKGYLELLNADTLYLLDKRIDSDFSVIFLSDETDDKAAEIVDRYFSKELPDGDFTRGLYYRGIF